LNNLQLYETEKSSHPENDIQNEISSLDNGIRFDNFLEIDDYPIPKILYESDNLIAIDKPPHIAHHDSETEPGILSYVRYLQSQSITNSFSYKGRIHGVHRLDCITSGILLLAKNQETASLLSQKFRDKDVTKYYVALTSKKPKKKKQGWVKGDMITSRRGSWKLTNTRNNPAITRFFTAGVGNLNTIGIDQTKTDEDLLASVILPKTMILFQPLSGKTHQLRVAAKSVGLSILGDKRYGDAIEAQRSKRTYLHACCLNVNLDGEEITIWNPPCDWFESFGCENDPTIEEALIRLMNKHCENEKILLEMNKSN